MHAACNTANDAPNNCCLHTNYVCNYGNSLYSWDTVYISQQNFESYEWTQIFTDLCASIRPVST